MPPKTLGRLFTSLVVGLLLAALSLALSLFIAERILGYYDRNAGLPANGLVGGVRYTWGHPVRENSYKARGSEPIVPKPAGVYRVLSLGDSLTWGAGVSESERYTGVAEALLNKIDAEKKIEFVNLAHSGAPLTSYRDRLFQFGETLDPDLLTVGFCLNDPQQKQQDFSEERQAYRRRNKGLLLLALDVRYYFPHLGESLNKGIMRWGEINGDFPSWDEALDRTYNPESTSWREFEQALADISKWNSDHTLPTPLFLILNQGSSTVDPTYYSNPDPLLKRFIGWWNQAGEAASRQGFRVINHEEEFRDQLDGKVLGVNIADGHPSAAEHKIYGEKLAHVIETEYLDIDEASASE